MSADNDQNEPPRAIFPIVGLGASAGGIEALSELLGALPANPGMAFLLVQHRDPGQASLLVELLAKTTRMLVRAAEDGLELKVDQVYVVPPDRTVSISGLTLHLRSYDTAEQRRMPIDAMFASLAEQQGSNSIGVVLSGTGSDGARGIQEIKGAGGITFAQEPGSARYSGMPEKAIQTGYVDFVLTPQAIAERILQIAAHPYLNHGLAGMEEKAPTDESSLRKILRLLRTQANVDFSQYKRNTIQRRLARRMALRQVQELWQYAELLREDRGEVEALVQDFLIRVTGFFRDPEEFRGLSELVFPRLLENRPQREILRIWIPGCASGEEVYSIAILLTEYLNERSITVPVQIFGTDLSDLAIRQARAGEYVSSIEREVSGERLRRFFVKMDDHYQVAKSLRDLCIFARHNLAYDPPFSRLDLVCCRNVMIYFDLNLQRQVIRSFHYALKPGGFLVLGPSESISQVPELFHPADGRFRIYRKLTVSGPPAVESPAIEPQAHLPAIRERTAAQLPVPADLPRAQREMERVLLARYAPASLLVDDTLNVVYFQGETGRYLEHARGTASFNLQSVLRPGLLIEVSSAIEQVRKEGAATRREHVYFEASGKTLAVNIEVMPLRVPESEAPFYGVFFEEAALPAAPRLTERVARWWRQLIPGTARPETQEDRRIRQLQRELEATRDYLRNAIEEHQAVQEELKSAHEEALSANEEFQSTNEELETAKEELQSANEELSTTNEELRSRIRQLDDANEALLISRDHLHAIFETMRQPLLVLDYENRVLEANSAFYEAFKLRPDEVEHRRIYEIANGDWNLTELRALLQGALLNEAAPQDVELTHEFATAGTRSLLLNARRLPGDSNVLLAIQDVTEHAHALALKEADRQKDQFLAMVSHELRNPLASIVNALQIIRLQGYETPGQERARQIIERQVGHLTRLIADLLEVSRISTGTVPLQREVVALQDPFERALETVRPQFEQRQHHLTVSVSPEPIYLDADPTRLEQVFINLLSNAAKYTDRGGQIQLSAQREDQRAIVRVRDNGMGIDASLLPHVFDIFTQSQQSLARSQGGLGIGLSVAKNLVELHGGSIAAYSEGLGKGSEFVVTLPIGGAPGDKTAAAVPENSPAPSGKPRRVLIVDDSEDAAESTALLFSAWNYEVRIAYSGPEALKDATEHPPDVILLDIGLPGMDGYEVARRLRADPRFQNTLLLAISGYGRDNDRRLSKQAGFDEHLVKPVDLGRLNELITEWLRHQGARTGGSAQSGQN